MVASATFTAPVLPRTGAVELRCDNCPFSGRCIGTALHKGKSNTIEKLHQFSVVCHSKVMLAVGPCKATNLHFMETSVFSEEQKAGGRHLMGKRLHVKEPLWFLSRSTLQAMASSKSLNCFRDSLKNRRSKTILALLPWVLPTTL